jgi:hypothetical protein
MTGNLTCPSFIKSGGTNIEYLMGDGSTLTQSATSGNSNFYLYDNTNSTTDTTPVSGEVIVNSLVNTTATIVYISHITRDNIDVEVFWKFVNTLSELYLQDQSLSTNYIQYNITAPPTITVGNKIAIPVAVVNSAGTGSTSFGVGHNILVSFFMNNLEVDTRLSTLETKTTAQSFFSGLTEFDGSSGVSIKNRLLNFDQGTNFELLLNSSTVTMGSDIINTIKNISCSKFITTGGSASQFVKGDGSLDTETYLPTVGGTVDALISSGGLSSRGISVIDLQMGNANSIFSGLEYNNGSAVISTRSNSSWTAIGSTSAVDFPGRGASNFRVYMPATALWSTTSLANGAVCGYTGASGVTGPLVFCIFPFGFMCNLSIQDTTYNENNCQNFFGVSYALQNLNQTTQLSDARTMIGFGSNTTDTNLCIYSASNTVTTKLVDLGVSFPANRTSLAVQPKEFFRLSYWWDGLYTLYYKCYASNQLAGTGVIVSGSVLMPTRPPTNAPLLCTISRTMGTPNTTGQAKLAVQKAGVWY